MMPDLPAARYDEFADWYADRAVIGHWVDATILANIEPMLGVVDGLHVLDLCCGEGSFARRLMSLGANVTGVDLSARLLDIALHRHAAQPVTYIQDDAQSLGTLDDDRFDGATCLMALMDVPDLTVVYESVRRVVRPGGWFVAVITHPCFESPHAGWTDDGSRITDHYSTEGAWFSRNPDGVRAKVGAHHRTLSTYVNEASRAGWVLDRLHEPNLLQQDNPNPDIPRLMFLRFR